MILRYTFVYLVVEALLVRLQLLNKYLNKIVYLINRGHYYAFNLRGKFFMRLNTRPLTLVGVKRLQDKIDQGTVITLKNDDIFTLDNKVVVISTKGSVKLDLIA